MKMYTKIKAGGDGYDIIVPSSDYVKIMSSQDLLEKLDQSKIQGENVNEVIMAKLKDSSIDEFSVPYMMVPTIMRFNKEVVKIILEIILF